ncbi:SRPBCC family protein [Verrucomicrobiota bacterium sgz303538]
MERIEKSIEVEVPLRTAYNQWTQFEEFPKFMEGVEEVRQLDDKHLFWRAQIAGKSTEWEAEIYEQIPDSRIAWRSTTGAPNAGAVAFQALGPERTRVNLVIDYQPLGVVEKVGDALGIVSSRVDGDLQRFKKFIQERGAATGGWRGEIR